MKVENPDRLESISETLHHLRELAEDRSIKVDHSGEQTPTKGELLISIAIDVGVALGASGLYDLLKVSAQRVLERNPSAKNDKLRVDDRVVSLEDISKDK